MNAQAMESEQLRRTTDPNEGLRVMRLSGQMRQLGLDCASKAATKCAGGWEAVQGQENRSPLTQPQEATTTTQHDSPSTGAHRRSTSGSVDWVMLA
jgi:osmotically-inducible protein OsmY